MSFYSTEYQSIRALLSQTFHYYPKAFKVGFLFIVLSVLSQNLTLLLTYFQSPVYVQLIVLVISDLLSLFFITATFVAIHQVLKAEPSSFFQNIKAAANRFIYVIVFSIIYIAIFIGMLFWLQYLNHMLGFSTGAMNQKWWADLFLVGLPLLLFFLLFLLTVPIIIVERKSVFVAMARSAKMVWLSQFKPTILLYAGIIVLFYLTLSGTRHALWLSQHHIKVLFDLVIFILLTPLIINYALFVVNNLANFLRDRALRMR